MKDFETKIKLSTIFHEYPLYDEFMIKYDAQSGFDMLTNSDTIRTNKISSMAYHSIPYFFNYANIADFLRESADSSVKKFPKELLVLYDMNNSPRKQVVIAPVEDSALVIKTDGVPAESFIDYDMYGNADFNRRPKDITSMPLFRILIKPDYKEIKKKYGAMAHI